MEFIINLIPTDILTNGIGFIVGLALQRFAPASIPWLGRHRKTIKSIVDAIHRSSASDIEVMQQVTDKPTEKIMLKEFGVL